MATPLSELLDTVLNDAGAREQFQLAPEAFLRAAGYRDLDAADVQEALFVLADGSPPAAATQLLAGGRAIGDPVELDGLDTPKGLAGASQGLVTAIDAMPLDARSDVELEPEPEPAADLDPLDDTADAAFGSGTVESDDDVDVSDLLDGDTFDAGTEIVAPEPTAEPAVDELAHDDEPLDGFDRPDDAAHADDSAIDDWDLD